MRVIPFLLVVCSLGGYTDAYSNYVDEWTTWAFGISQYAQVSRKSPRASFPSHRELESGTGPRGGATLEPLHLGSAQAFDGAFILSSAIREQYQPGAVQQMMRKLEENSIAKQSHRDEVIIKMKGFEFLSGSPLGNMLTLFAPTHPCVWTQNLYGGKFSGKWLCGLREVGAAGRPCVVYSFGHAGDAAFERAVKTEAPSCEIRTFDPTPPVPTKEFQKKWGIDAFHALGIDPSNGKGTVLIDKLGPVLGLREIMRRNGHRRVDFLKIDVEGMQSNTYCLLKL